MKDSRTLLNRAAAVAGHAIELALKRPLQDNRRPCRLIRRGDNAIARMGRKG